MNKKDREEVKAVKRLIKDIKKEYGANCPELNIDCGSCKAQLLISMLEWHSDNIEWKCDTSPIKKNIIKIKNMLKNGIKKSKTVGKF